MSSLPAPSLQYSLVFLWKSNVLHNFFAQLLLHHVIPGAFDLSSLQDEMTGVSLAGTQLRVNTYNTQDVEWNDVQVRPRRTVCYAYSRRSPGKCWPLEIAKELSWSVPSNLESTAAKQCCMHPPPQHHHHFHPHAIAKENFVLLDKKKRLSFIICPHACYVPCLSQAPWCDYTTNACERVLIMQIRIPPSQFLSAPYSQRYLAHTLLHSSLLRTYTK